MEFPFGRSLNENRIIQLDSKDGVGRVAPDLRIPLIAERVIKYAEGKDVELEYVENFLQQM